MSIVFSADGIEINGHNIVGIDTVSLFDEGDPEGVLGVEFFTDCSRCDGEGFRYGRRCEWCINHASLGYVTPEMATVPAGEIRNLKEWVARHQFRPTGEHTQTLADAFADALIRLRNRAVMAVAQ